MTEFVIYDSTNGSIRRTGDAPDEMLSLQVNDINDELLIPVIDVQSVGSDTHYIVNDEITERPVVGSLLVNETPANGLGDTIAAQTGEENAVIITGIPAGTECIISVGNSILLSEPSVDDGEVELASDVSGSYKIRLIKYPNREAVFIVEFS